MPLDIEKLCVSPENSIQESLAQMDLGRTGIVLVVDSLNRLIGTVTDGDMRRAVLARLDLEGPITQVLAQKEGSTSEKPITAAAGTDSRTLLETLRTHSIRHLPLVDDEERVVALVTIDDFVPRQDLPVQPVIMAGGLGLRLRPLTDDVPKPMLPVGGKPLLESILEQLYDAGVSQVNLITNYKKEVISGHFGDGAGFGVDIQYVEETQPLGTAGGLGLLEISDKPLLVVNGDVFTKVDFRAMVDFHRDNNAEMTVAVKELEFPLPYGVIETDGPRITGIAEKPVIRHFINAGIYLLDSFLCSRIPAGQPYDMTDMIALLVNEGRQVVSFPVHEYWRDIGQAEDYLQAQEDFRVVNSQDG